MMFSLVARCARDHDHEVVTGPTKKCSQPKHKDMLAEFECNIAC
jgi:hypothetical protein